MTSSIIDDDLLWSHYDEMLKCTVDPETPNFVDSEVPPDINLTSTSYYKTMNCGNDSLNGTKIGIPFSNKTSKLSRSLAKCEHAADTKRSSIKSQMMNEDLNRLEQIIRGKNANIGDVHVKECRRVYLLIAECMEKLKMKRNKAKVEIAASYYALKQFFNPTPSEIESMFSSSHTLFLTAIKQARHIAHNCPDELGWFFDVERGQTNIYRYATDMGLNYQKVRQVQKLAEQKGLNLQDESTVVNLLKRMKDISEKKKSK